MVDELRELVRIEREEAAESDRLHGLDADVAELRSRAEHISRFFAGERAEETRLQQAENEARSEFERRESEVSEAEAELERATDDDERALAEQRLTRARDHLEVATHTAEQAAELHFAFEREADDLARELPELERHARELATEIPGASSPGDDLVEWASHAHAAAFLAVGQIDMRREQAIREANELATAILGEPTYGSTPAQALARVERHWTSSPGHVSDRR